MLFDKIKKSISIVNVGVASATIVPIAYLLGSSYYQGYLSAFGVEAKNFPISTQEVYIYSYEYVSNFLFRIWSYILIMLEYPEKFWILIILLVTILICYVILTVQDKYHFLRDFFRELLKTFSFSSWRINNFTKSIWITFIAFESASLIIIFLLIIPFSWWGIPMLGQSEGQRVALLTKTPFEKNGCSAQKNTGIDSCSIIQDKDGKILHEGLLIAISDKDIAMFKKDGSYIFTRQNDWVIRRKLH
ncbi:MAG: hypothetical protein Q3M24_18770 [Candidatus Electrothrix aestuarii]|uniref:Uncharacterized protein n=1 Tax=Candidatus Electrothrix aestuarii TaxID=3062594 RepID=A0AAU8LTW2_9BACT|nr:hypothetical protein [Candidatus Electrothrix aestuarii]